MKISEKRLYNYLNGGKMQSFTCENYARERSNNKGIKQTHIYNSWKYLIHFKNVYILLFISRHNLRISYDIYPSMTLVWTPWHCCSSSCLKCSRTVFCKSSWSAKCFPVTNFFKGPIKCKDKFWTVVINADVLHLLFSSADHSSDWFDHL